MASLTNGDSYCLSPGFAVGQGVKVLSRDIFGYKPPADRIVYMMDRGTGLYGHMYGDCLENNQDNLNCETKHFGCYCVPGRGT